MAANIIWQLSVARQTYTVIKGPCSDSRILPTAAIKLMIISLPAKHKISSCKLNRIFSLHVQKPGVQNRKDSTFLFKCSEATASTVRSFCVHSCISCTGAEEFYHWGRRGRRLDRRAPLQTAGWRLLLPGWRPVWWSDRPPCRWWCGSSAPSSSPDHRPAGKKTTIPAMNCYVGSCMSVFTLGMGKIEKNDIGISQVT